jgi:hypothetical protein
MVETTQKVNPETEPKPEAEENSGTTEGQAADTDAKKDKGKVEFVIKGAQYRDADGGVVSAVNGDGLLIAVPKPIRDDNKKIVYAGFNVRKHIPLKKTAFASLTDFFLFQGFTARVRAALLIKGAEDKEKKAAHISKFGDEQTRKKVARMARMKEQLATLTAQLVDDGVDVSDI